MCFFYIILYYIILLITINFIILNRHYTLMSIHNLPLYLGRIYSNETMFSKMFTSPSAIRVAMRIKISLLRFRQAAGSWTVRTCMGRHSFSGSPLTVGIRDCQYTLQLTAITSRCTLHPTRAQRCINAGPASQMLSQH